MDNPFRPKPPARLQFTSQVNQETSQLPPERAAEFHQWVAHNNIHDLDQPDSHYDYRGAFLASIGSRSSNGHWPDTFKQHGHPTFSEESQYSKGRGDGGTWQGPNRDQYTPPDPQPVGHLTRTTTSPNPFRAPKSSVNPFRAGSATATVTPSERSHAAAQFAGASKDEQPVEGETYHAPSVGEAVGKVDQFVRRQNANLVDPHLAEIGKTAKQAVAGTAELGLGLAKTWPTAGAFVYGGKEAGQAAAAPFERAGHAVADWAGPPQTTVEGLARVGGPFLPGMAATALHGAQVGREAAAILPRVEGSLNYANKVDDLHALMLRAQQGQEAETAAGNQATRMVGHQGVADQVGRENLAKEGELWRGSALGDVGNLLEERQFQLEGQANRAHTVANNPSEMGQLGRDFDAKQLAARQVAAQNAPARAQFPEVAGALERRYPANPSNPFRSQTGATSPEVLGALAGGAAGAAHGYATADPEDSKVTRVVTQGLLGAAGGYAVAKGAGMLARSTPPTLPPAIQTAYERAQGQIDWGGRAQRAVNRRAAGGILARIQAISENVANGKAPLERLGRQAEQYGLRPTQNPRYLMSYVKSEDQTIHMAMTEGVPDPVTRVPVGIGYKQITEPFGNDEEKIKQGFTYVMAERGVARGPTAYGQNIQGYHDDVALTNHFRGDQSMLDFRDRVENFVDGIGSYAVRSKLWTPEQWAAMRQSDAVYVPWKRVMEDFLRQQHPNVGGSGLANVTSGVKGFVGSGRIKADPALALAEYAQAIIRRADRYRIGHSLFDAADAMGPAGDVLITRVAAPTHTQAPLRQAAINQALARANAQGIHLNQTTIETLDDLHTPVFDAKTPVIWRNGPQGREYAQVNVPTLWRAVQKLNQVDDDGLRKFLDLTIRPLKRIFVATTTGLTPRFAGGTNPARDVADAMTKSQAGLRPDDIAVGYASAIGGKTGVAKYNQLYQDSQRFGLGSVSNFSYPTSAKSYQHMFAPTSKLDKLKALGRQAGALPIRPFEAFGEVSDLGPRLGEMKAGMRQKQHLVTGGQYGPAGAPWTPEDQKLYGATLGREVTLDFQNKPGNPVLKLLADYVPFFGPSTQAPIAMLGAARRNPTRVLAGTLGAAVIPATIAWVMKHRSPQALEKTNDRNPGERGAFLMFPMDDEGNVTIRVALGQELGLVAAGVTAGLDAWMDHDPHAAGVFTQAIKRALPPIGVPVLNALVENMRNKRSFGDTPVEPHRLLEEKPEDRRLPTTNPTFDVLARAARVVPGLQNTSPLQAENVFRSVFSNTTPGITEVTDPIAEKLGGVAGDRKLPVPWRQNPLNPLGTFFANPVPRTTASEQDYYRMRESATQARASAMTAYKSGSQPDFERVLGKYENELGSGTRDILRSADKHLKAFRAGEVATQSAYRAGKLTGEEARQALDQYQEQRQETYRIAVDLLRQATAK